LTRLVLVVEDDANITRLLRDILQANGHRVIETPNGREAIELALKEKPDLITMDIYLEEFSGLDAIRNLKTDHSTKDIPIIAITAAAMKGQEQEAMEAGCDAFIRKPFRIDTLLDKLNELLPRSKE
jgi:two-component system cell cycle response regulator DivK